jgi:hypothetical protein
MAKVKSATSVVIAALEIKYAETAINPMFEPIVAKLNKRPPMIHAR